MQLVMYVVSHDQKILDEVPERNHLRKVLLQDLQINREFLGEELAENRFLLTKDLCKLDVQWCGFASARWNHRFPKKPSLDALDQLFRNEKDNLSPNYFFAPNSMSLSQRQLKSWVRAQNDVHPGMGEILYKLIDFNEIDVNQNRIFNVVMGNCFIVSREIASDFLNFWQKNFWFLYKEFGLEAPFSYRCQLCGFSSTKGFDRWTNRRHAGYLLERVSSLFFTSRSDLHPIQFKPSGISFDRKTFISPYFGIGLLLSLGSARFLNKKDLCNHKVEN